MDIKPYPLMPTPWITCLVVASLVVSACTGADGPSADSHHRGPLVLPDGLGVVMAPTDKTSYITIEGCSDAPGEMTIEAVEPVSPWGPDEIQWKVAWATEERPVLVGAERGRPSKRFGLLPSSNDHPGRCGDPGAGPVLAAVFGEPRDRDIGVDGIRVRYTMDGVSYDAEYEVRVGVCSKAAIDPIVECR